MCQFFFLSKVWKKRKILMIHLFFFLSWILKVPSSNSPGKSESLFLRRLFITLLPSKDIKPLLKSWCVATSGGEINAFILRNLWNDRKRDDRVLYDLTLDDPGLDDPGLNKTLLDETVLDPRDLHDLVFRDRKRFGQDHNKIRHDGRVIIAWICDGQVW